LVSSLRSDGSYSWSALTKGDTLSRMRFFLCLFALSLATACVSDEPTANRPTDAGVASDAARNIIYVDGAGGDDARDGLSIATRRKTIAGAVSAATKIANAEIHVCRGVYQENDLKIATSLTLRGAYDCFMFDRIAGFPGAGGPDANETRIIPSQTSTEGSALQVDGSIELELEGFTIAGAEMSTNTTRAIRVGAGARVRLVNNRIVAASNKVTGDGVNAAVGLEVVNATVVAEKNQFVGGNSDARDGAGLVLVNLYDAGGSVVSDNVFDGGSPSGTRGSILVNIGGSSSTVSADSVRVERNTLRGGSPNATVARGAALIAFGVVGKQRAELVGNRVTGTRARCSSGEGCSVFGALVSGGSVATVRGNLIEAGTMTRDPSALHFFRGLVVSENAEVVAENNVILNGTVMPSAAVHFDSIGLLAEGTCSKVTPTGPCIGPITSSSKATFRHNTVQVSPVSGSNERSRGIWSTASGVIAENNLFIGKTADRGIEWYPCLQALKNNVFLFENVIEEAVSVVNFDSKLCDKVVPQTIAEAQVDQPVMKGNFRLNNVAQVLRDANEATWLGNPNGLELLPTAPCSVARPEPPNPLLPTDVLGRMRDRSKPSAGAYEFQGMSCSQ
jgi:hypothetical protein